ncbi:MAG: 8-oxo-dGTP pyrophosphatase MutT (NUDIX family) [Myxococcota bacterium]|jgi:8-oxo-dGTP pyrophosphatase MutT (NUDIX family)
MQIIYAKQPHPSSWSAAIFLAGPTPRSADVPSWRPEALRLLEAAGYNGVVFIPEDAEGEFRGTYIDQVAWERDALAASDCVLFWVPRDLSTMPAFTTNVEFGLWVQSGRAVLGYPKGSPKNRYLGWLAREHKAPVCHTLAETVQTALDRVTPGAERSGGERGVPLMLWRTPSFQGWYRQLLAAGNALESARLRWSYTPSRATQPFVWILQVKVWIAVEERFKKNEWVFARSDLSAVLLHGPVAEDVMQTEVVLVREYRAPARTADGFIYELPGGSSYTETDPEIVAAEEVHEETGLHIASDRLIPVASRQLAGTLSSHIGHLYRVALSAAELEEARALIGTEHGVEGSSERTMVMLWTVGEIVADERTDWSTVGMVLAALRGV